METCILLSARRYSFEDDKGQQVQGVTLNYLTEDVDDDLQRRGSAPLTINAPSELFDALGPLPGVYDVDFKQRPGRGGRPSLQVVRVAFRRPLDVFGSASGAAPGASS